MYHSNSYKGGGPSYKKKSYVKKGEGPPLTEPDLTNPDYSQEHYYMRGGRGHQSHPHKYRGGVSGEWAPRGGRGGRGRGKQTYYASGEENLHFARKPEAQKYQHQFQKTEYLDDESTRAKKYHEKLQFVSAEEFRGKKKKGAAPLLSYKAQDFIAQFDDLSQQCIFLTKGLCNAEIECIICRNPIYQKARIWSCKQCSSPIHLSCMQNWIKSVFFQQNPNHQANLPKHQKMKQFQPQLNQLFNWTCPNCNLQYTENFPEYYCFCGDTIEPQFSEYLLPHSCGKLCGRKKHPHCTHASCNVLCHPGACPSCGEYVSKFCCCGKKKEMVRCAYSNRAILCTSECGKPLSCGSHQCNQTCHEGDCKKCTQKENVNCYCGKKEDDVPCGVKSFSCHNICNKPLGCKNHFCQDICHPGPCKPCRFSPTIVKTCHCGKESLQLLLVQPRQKCTDLIPSCHQKCNRPLPCGHYCLDLCHEGKCKPCGKQVRQNCRCGKQEREFDCYKINYSNEALIKTFAKTETESLGPMEESKEFNVDNFVKKLKEDAVYRCERVCKTMKNCKKHKCEEICCPSRKHDRQQIHRCLLICEKQLSCSKHNCPDFCHTGPCRPCKVYSLEPLTCRCGAEVINPPVPCGQPYPDCKEPCKLSEKQCGHPCHSRCHMGPCPSCIEIVSKNCNCGKKILHNIRCGSLNLSCGQACGLPLPCGHSCSKVCHKIGKCFKDQEILVKEGCGNKCNKPRKYCDHRCQEPCHPNQECPEVPCTAQIRLNCECGFRHITVQCHAREDASASLQCSQECKRRQRDLKLAKAFGNLEDEKSRERAQLLIKEYYPEEMISWASKNASYVQKIESLLNSIVYSKGDGVSLPQMQGEKKLWICKLVKDHYYLKYTTYGNSMKRVIDVYYTEDSRIPEVLLSEYVRLIQKGVLSSSTKERKSPFNASLYIYNVSREHSLDQLKDLIDDFKHLYYPEYDNKSVNKAFYLHFYSLECAQLCMRKLKATPNPFTSIKFIDHSKVKLVAAPRTSDSDSDDDSWGVSKKKKPQIVDEDGFTFA